MQRRSARRVTARARSSAPEAGVAPGRMKPSGMVTDCSRSAMSASSLSTCSWPVCANDALESGLVASSAPSEYRPRCSSSQIERTRGWRLSDFARPTALDASSMVPYASMRGSSLRARPPPRSPVEPSSPDPASSSIFFLRGGTSRLLEDPAQFVQLPGDASRFLDHISERDNLDIAVAPDWNHPAPAGDDQLDSRDSEARGPDAVGRRGRSATLQVPEHGATRLNSGLALDIAGKEVADSPFGKPGVPESVLLCLAAGLRLALRDLRAFSDDDDAEQLAFPAPAIKVSDDLL